MRSVDAICTLLLGAGGCLLIGDLDVYPPLIDSAGMGGIAGSGGVAGLGGMGGNGGAGGEAGGQAGAGGSPCTGYLLEFPDRTLKHLAVEPGPTGRIYYTTALDTPEGAGGNGAVLGEIRHVDKNGGGDTRFLDAPSVPDFIQLTTTSVLFTTSLGEVASMPVDDSEEPLTFGMAAIAAGLTVPNRQLEVAFWHDHRIGGVPATGGPFSPAAPLSVTMIDNGWGMAVDATDPAQVYWTAWGSNGTNGTVAWRPDFNISYDFATNQDHPSGIALDATHVFWIQDSGEISRHLRGDPMTMAPPPGDTEMVVAPQGPNAGLGSLMVLDDDYIYWGGLGGLYRAPKAGMGVDPELLHAAALVSDVAMDEAFVYGVTWHDGQLIKCPR